MQQHYLSHFCDSVIHEWKMFRAYLLTQKKGHNFMSQREVCVKLVQDGVLKDIYPQLSLAAEIFLIASISTATMDGVFQR